jgi:hypothetical protein
MPTFLLLLAESLRSANSSRYSSSHSENSFPGVGAGVLIRSVSDGLLASAWFAATASRMAALEIGRKIL